MADVDILSVPKISDSTQLSGKSLTISDDIDGTPYRFSGDTIKNAIEEIADKVDQVDGYQLIATTDVNRLADTSGTNTGDQQASDFDIKDLTDSASLRNTWSGKQDALGFTPENVANKTQTITNSETDYPSGKAVYNANNLCNVTLAVPLTAGQYYTSTTARAAVPSGVRKRGLELVYETSAGVWYCERFIGASVTTWTTSTDWEVVPNKKYVDDAGALKVNNTTLENTEEVTAEALVQLKNRIDALQKIIQDMILGSVQIDSLNIVKTFNLYGSSNMILTGSAAPAVVPDFIGQFFIKTSATTACYQATGNSSVGDWKQIG